jgi:MFS family permease
MMFSIMIGATLSNVLLKRWTYRAGIIASMTMAGLGMLGMSYMPLDVSFWIVAFVMLLMGIGIGILMPLAQMAVTYSAADRIKGIATSTVGFSRAVGGVFGSAVLAAIVNNRLSVAVQEHAAEFNVQGDELAGLTDPQLLLSADSTLSAAATGLFRQALGDSVQLGFWFLVVVAGLGIIAAVWTGTARFETDVPSSPVKDKSSNSAAMPGIGH